jgi:hypothetical protein
LSGDDQGQLESGRSCDIPVNMLAVFSCPSSKGVQTRLLEKPNYTTLPLRTSSHTSVFVLAEIFANGHFRGRG